MICKICYLILGSLIGAILTWAIIEKCVKCYIREGKPKQKSEDSTTKNNNLSEASWLAFVYGFIEILLFSSFILAQKANFIFLWLAIKTAFNWSKQQKKGDELTNFKPRGLYYSYLIGSTINIIWGFIIACLIDRRILDCVFH